MHKERLEYLADALEYDANNPSGMKFDLNDWMKPGDYGRGISSAVFNEYIDKGWKPAQNCGTAGCAIGLACLLPAFNEAGFRIDDIGGPVYKDYKNWDAVRAFFGINVTLSWSLFDPDYYDERKGAEAELAVAARIREKIKEHADA